MTESQKAKKPKSQKKKKHHRPQHRFNSKSPTSVISSSLISKNKNTPQAQIVKTVDSQTFYWVLILEGKDHRLNLNTC